MLSRLATQERSAGLAKKLPSADRRREWLAADGVAGVTLAAYAVPVSLAYATLISRLESALLCFNVEYVRNIVRQRIASWASLQLVLCDLSNSPQFDIAGARMLSALQTASQHGARDCD